MKIGVGTVAWVLVFLSIASCKHAGSLQNSSDDSAIAAASVQSVRPSRDSCVYYLHQEINRQCVYRQGVGSKYLTHFGYNYCNKFLYTDLAARSPEMAYFLVSVRYCLQKKLAAIDGKADCRSMERAAMDSHLGCYLEARFCALALDEQVAVAKVIAGFDILPTLAESVEVFVQIEKSCKSEGLTAVARSLAAIGRRSKALSQDDLKKVDEIFARAPKEESRILAFFSKFLASLGVQFDPDRKLEPGQLGLTDEGKRLSDEEFRQGIDQFYRQL